MIVLKNLIVPPDANATVDDSILIDLKKEANKEESDSSFKLTRIFLTGIEFAYRSHLIHLMACIIRWRLQPQKRTRKLLVIIVSTRIELEILEEEKTIIEENFIYTIWDKCFENAVKLASAESGIRNITFPPLTKKDVFETEFLYNKIV